MTWKSFHSRGETLRAVIAAADDRRDGTLPLDVDGVAESFADELDLLGALQLRWHTRLAGHVERELSRQPFDLEDAVVAAWHATADELPGVLAVLDHHRAAPADRPTAEAMARATAKQHALLAMSAGRASAADEVAVRVGAAIESRARATHRPVRAAADPRPPRLLDRLRAALAAA